MAALVILPAARQDLVEIGDFIALDDPHRLHLSSPKFTRQCVRLWSGQAAFRRVTIYIQKYGPGDMAVI